MVAVNHASREITCKLVYYGPGLCGKTTNLKYLFQQWVEPNGGELVSLATPGERTLYFDFMPLKMARINEFTVKFALYTVPGQVMYGATRKLVLRGVDGIIFVADSQWDIMEDNVESWQDMVGNLSEYGINLTDIPCVLQYNKRDMPNIAPVWYMDHLLNHHGWPAIEASAVAGNGVQETLNTLCRYVVRGVVHRLGNGML